jgi:hypothetical protein
MRTRFATLAVALLPLPIAAPAAALPTELNVRVEGATQTLFEGPLLTDGRTIRASSDDADRTCDATNNGSSPTPGPTPTAATVDAMAVIGEDFDGRWYAGFDDYFIQRWGPDAEDADSYAYWGILVNGSFTPVGGCQYASAADDDVLWVYDAFDMRPFLRLSAAADPTSAPTAPLPTAFVDEGDTLTVEVERYSGAMDGGPQGRGVVEGVEVAPVATDPDKRYQQPLVDDAAAVTTRADGSATISFATPGWHRLKAADDALYVRSNRLDVCVRPTGAGDCGPLPPDALVRSAPTPEPDPDPEPSPRGGGKPGDPPAKTDDPPPARPQAKRVRMTVPAVAVDRRRGVANVRWRVLERGVGVRRWTIAARALGRRGARFTNRASGRSKTRAALKLPRGRTFALRLTVVDNSGRRTTRSLGRVRVPLLGSGAR